jgi:MoxR-like ATPase
MDDIDYLWAMHITKLQTAARMAGLHWKSGTAGYDKTGIIQKLHTTPDRLQATITYLRKMEKGEKIPPSRPMNFLSDIEEEKGDNTSVPYTPPVTHAASIPQQTSGDNQFHITADEWNNILHKVGAIAADYTTRRQAKEIASKAVSEAFEPLSDSVATLKAEVQAIRRARPVVFTIGDKVSTLPITGQHYLFPKMVQFLESQDLEYRNVLLIGPASSGKSRAARAFAELKGLTIYSQPQTVDSFGVLGIETPTKIIVTPFAEAWENGGVLLIDEISMNGSDAIGAMNDALAGGFAALPGKGYVKRHHDCYIIAGDNSDTGASAKYSARQVLDGSTLDRFIRLEWPIDPEIETALAGDQLPWRDCVRAIRQYIDDKDIQHVGATTRAVIQGRDMLNRGTSLTRQDILESTCKKGILRDSWEQILRLPAVIRFLQGA